MTIKYPVFWSFFNILKFRQTRHIGPPPHPPCHPTLTESWCQERINVWKRGALDGILNQTVRDWQYFLLCDSRTRPWLSRMLANASNSDPRVIPIWMDYASGEAPWDPQGASQIKQIIRTADQYYLFRSDSDDKWHPQVAETALNLDARGKPYILFQKGYIWDWNRKELKHYVAGSGPMHIHIYNKDQWPGEIWSEGPHNFVEEAGCIYGPPGLFLVSVHDMNTTTHFNTPQCHGHVAPGEERELAIREFNLNYK